MNYPLQIVFVDSKDNIRITRMWRIRLFGFCGYAKRFGVIVLSRLYVVRPSFFFAACNSHICAVWQTVYYIQLNCGIYTISKRIYFICIYKPSVCVCSFCLFGRRYCRVGLGAHCLVGVCVLLIKNENNSTHPIYVSFDRLLCTY